MKAAQPICIAFSNADVSKSEVLISSNAIGVTGGNEGIITIPRFAGDWGVYRIVFFDKGLSVNAIVWFWVNSKGVTFKDIAVETQQNKYVIFASTTDFPLAIPVITNHGKTRNTIDIISRDSTDWIIYSNYSQKVTIRMHILPVR